MRPNTIFPAPSTVLHRLFILVIVQLKERSSDLESKDLPPSAQPGDLPVSRAASLPEPGPSSSGMMMSPFEQASTAPAPSIEAEPAPATSGRILQRLTSSRPSNLEKVLSPVFNRLVGGHGGHIHEEL